MTWNTIEIDESDGIHTVTLNRPERRNALNRELIAELTEALDAVESCACGAVILTGAGTAFCAGMDLEELKALPSQPPEDQAAGLEDFVLLMRRLYELSKPTIAAVNGPALAGGTGLALQCDFTLAAPGAKFGYTEVRIGFVPAVVSVFLIPMIGEKRARNLLLSGRLLGSEEALAWGLVTEVAPEGELISRARSLAGALLKNSPESMRAMKKLLNSFSRKRLNRDLGRALRSSGKVRGTADFSEGIQAFFEKRDPVWPSRKN
jgi:methylglutaconyl-CoA hydratase